MTTHVCTSDERNCCYRQKAEETALPSVRSERMLAVSDVLAQMDKIIEDHPGTMEYQEDGRYTWPERWNALREWFTANAEREGQDEV